ncbi:MAG: hypothetical protein RL701_1269 [Pseudomonadota bacterium]|jgi:hypothetical protein
MVGSALGTGQQAGIVNVTELKHAESTGAGETPDAQLAYLRDRVQYRIGVLKASAESNRRASFRGQIATMLLSAVITVVTGAKSLGECNPLVSDVVLVFSALTAVISGWNAFAAPREVWRLKTLTLGRLLSLEGRLEFAVRGRDFERERADVLRVALADLDAILADYNQEWQSLRSSGK